MKTRPNSGKPADKKAKYVRISIAAYEKIKAKAKLEGRTFVRSLDLLLKLK